MKDNEWAGKVNHYNYGARMHDTRIARFISIDPLTKKYPMLTPYQFASNRPIEGVDLDGKEFWNSTTIFSLATNVVGGLGAGGAAGIQAGTAYDMVGKTHFTAYTAIGPSNQDLSDGSRNPQIIFGAEASGNIGVQFAYNKPTFAQASNAFTGSASLVKPTNVSAKAGWGLGATFGIEKNGSGLSSISGVIGLSAGLGLGASLTTGNQSILSSSISMTYAEDKRVGTMVQNPTAYRVTGVTPIHNSAGNITGWSGQVEANGGGMPGIGGKLVLTGNIPSGTWVATGVKVYSDNQTGSGANGTTTNAPAQNWETADYANGAAEKGGGSSNQAGAAGGAAGGGTAGSNKTK